MMICAFCGNLEENCECDQEFKNGPSEEIDFGDEPTMYGYDGDGH